MAHAVGVEVWTPTASTPQTEGDAHMSTTSHLITGVDFVVVPTDDFEGSVRFYDEVLGLPCIARYGQMPGAEFQAGNLTLAVMQNEAFGQPFSPNSMPIALRVADVDAVR